MSDLVDYASPVRSSIMSRDLILGVSSITFFILAGVSWVIMYNLQEPVFLVITVVLYIVARILMKRDEYMVEILIESLLLPDKLHI